MVSDDPQNVYYPPKSAHAQTICGMPPQCNRTSLKLKRNESYNLERKQPFVNFQISVLSSSRLKSAPCLSTCLEKGT